MNLEEYVMHGKCQDFHSGLSPEDWQVYRYGQADHAAQMIDEVIDSISLPPNASDLLDPGGAHGVYSVALCRRDRNLRARVLDLAITAGEKEQCASDGAYERVKFEVGDIRTVPLQHCSNDVILLANVLHRFDESTNCDLMRRVAFALRPGGIAIVIDPLRCSSFKKMDQLEVFWISILALLVASDYGPSQGSSSGFEMRVLSFCGLCQYVACHFAIASRTKGAANTIKITCRHQVEPVA